MCCSEHLTEWSRVKSSGKKSQAVNCSLRCRSCSENSFNCNKDLSVNTFHKSAQSPYKQNSKQKLSSQYIGGSNVQNGIPYRNITFRGHAATFIPKYRISSILKRTQNFYNRFSEKILIFNRNYQYLSTKLLYINTFGIFFDAILLFTVPWQVLWT